MRPEECHYWDGVYEARNFLDNYRKRGAIAHRIFAIDWLSRRILEIGVGLGTIAAAIHTITLENVKYIGTEVSPVMAERCSKMMRLNVANTDILNLPSVEGGFDRVIALDSLEHIRPEDRKQGYKNIGSVMAENATMVINMPLSIGSHDQGFDHPFGLEDIDALCRLADLKLAKYERYSISYPKGDGEVLLRYAWVVLKRGRG
jgi:SAM-dependent methyltransferase